MISGQAVITRMKECENTNKQYEKNNNNNNNKIMET